MPIISFNTEIIGQVGQVPKIIYVQTNDTLSTVTNTVGYLNEIIAQGGVLSTTDFAVISTKDSPFVSLFNLSFSNGNWSVIPQQNVSTTLSSLTFNPSTSGIIGTTAGDNASAGIVGEYVSSQVLFADGIFLNAVSQAPVTTIVLTAGDWDVFGNVVYSVGEGAQAFCWIDTIPDGSPDLSIVNVINQNQTENGTAGSSTPYVRLSISNAITVYLMCKATVGTDLQIAGGIFARRVR